MTQWRGVWKTWEITEIHTGFWWKMPTDRGSLVNLGVGRKITLKSTLKKLGGGGGIHLAQIGTDGGLL
jgi:hypothetical protein